MIINRGDFVESLYEDQFNNGTIKFNIPNEDDIYSGNGEGVWGWVNPEDMKRYSDQRYHGKITAILLNTPLNYFGRLNWGDDVLLLCHGKNRPTLDPDWVKYNLLQET